VLVAFGADLTIDDHVCHMDPVRTELARHALGEGAQGEFGGSQVHETGTAPQGRGCTGKKDRALPVLEHDPRGGSSYQEPGKAADPPAVLEIRRVGLYDLTAFKGTRIEHRDAQRAIVRLNLLKQSFHVLGHGGIAIVQDHRVVAASQAG
jgi:hypothetical protein